MSAPSRLAGPIFEELKYVEEDDPITDMYLNLPTKATNKEQMHNAHPAFAKIIGLLSADEVLMLHLLGQRDFEETYISELDRKINRFVDKVITSREFPVQDLTYQENYFVYISHLTSLNLLSFPVYK